MGSHGVRQPPPPPALFPCREWYRSATNTDDDRVVTVVGTAGISEYIEASMRLSFSFLSYHLRVLELLPPGTPGKLHRHPPHTVAGPHTELVEHASPYGMSRRC